MQRQFSALGSTCDGLTRQPNWTIRGNRPTTSRSSTERSDQIGRWTSASLYATTRRIHLRSGLHVHRKLRIEDHLHRRRRGRPALSRLSDRPARRARRLSRILLPAALRRTADQDAEGRFDSRHHAPHDGARADERASSPASAATRIPMAVMCRRGRRAVGLLSRLDRHLRSAPAHGRRVDPHDRQDADDRGDGLQVFIGQPFIYPKQRSRLLRRTSCRCASPCRARSTRSTRCWRARSTASSSCTPTTSRTPRPRPCASPARRAPIRSPASPPASPACGAPRMAAPMKPRSTCSSEIGTSTEFPNSSPAPRTRTIRSA
jgi:hypothetical protein